MCVPEKLGASWWFCTPKHTQSRLGAQFAQPYEAITVSYNPTKFGGHRHSVSGDKVFLVCHKVSKDHMIKWSCDLLPSLVAIDILVVEIQYF